MMIARALACGACLIAASVSAESPGSEALRFTEEGAISHWTVSQGSLKQTFIEAADKKLLIEILVNGRLSELHWERILTEKQFASFEASNSQHNLLIRRRYQPSNGELLVHTLSIVNLSEDVVSVDISMRMGGALQGSSDGQRSLADFVYGFHRQEVQTASKEWKTAIAGSSSQRFAMTSRHKTLVVDADQPFVIEARSHGERLGGTEHDWRLVWRSEGVRPGEVRTFRQSISALPTSTAKLDELGYASLMYSDLWSPMAGLSRLIERVLTGLSAVAWGPAVAIMLLAIAVRVVTLPVSLWSARRQREFAEIQERMKPQIAQVKADSRGAEQSERILAIYRYHGISPFSGLKGSIGLFIQIPFLLAVFNITTASTIFAGESFLWISNLSLPDTAALLPVTIPLLGSHLNALPITLGVVNVISLRRQTGQGPSGSKIMPVVITLLIIFLFYSFAAAVVLYWLTVNLIQGAERALLRRMDRSAVAEADESIQVA